MYIEGNSDISAQMERNLTIVKKSLILPKEQSAPVKKGRKQGHRNTIRMGKRIGQSDILYGETIKRRIHDWLEKPVRHFFVMPATYFDKKGRLDV